MELLPRAYYSSQNKNFVSTCKNFLKKINWTFAAVIFLLFLIKTRVFLKYFLNDCGCFHMDMNDSNQLQLVLGRFWLILGGFEWWWLL